MFPPGTRLEVNIFLFPGSSSAQGWSLMPCHDPENAQDPEESDQSWAMWERRAALTFHRRGEDDEVVIEELPVLNEGQAGVICGLEREFKGPVWTRRKQGAEADGTPGETAAARVTTVPASERPELEVLLWKTSGERVAAALGLGSLSKPTVPQPPPRAPVSPFRLRKKSECVSRRLRLSSSTKVRGPLAQTEPSKGSSSHRRDQAGAAAPGSIFLSLQRTQVSGHRKCPAYAAQSQLADLE